jgi:hypothetical protein
MPAFEVKERFRTGHLQPHGRTTQLQEKTIVYVANITEEQAVGSFLGVIGFLPLTLCTGYLAAWITNLCDFRNRSLIERFFWSIPLSVSISTITSVLIARFLSLSAVVLLLALCSVCWVVLLVREWRTTDSRLRVPLGLDPLGVKCIGVIIVWAALILLALVDWQRGDRLLMSLAVYDHGARVNWAESILRTGTPPANPFYFFRHAANLRYYYFWLLDCAAIAKFWHLPVRASLAAGCVWAAICLAAITGLYLKHFLEVGSRLRRQFLLAISLFAVAGTPILVFLWNMFVRRIPFPGEVWHAPQITDWTMFFLFYPHHLASMVCCMFGFLLAWLPAVSKRDLAVRIVLIAAAMASAFGLSVYVAFAFLLVTAGWACWQILQERAWRRPLVLAAGGLVAGVLLLPYLREISHGESRTYGSRIFSLHVRETLPPEPLLNAPPLRNIASASPELARNLAKLILLLPAYTLELGVYMILLFVFLVPSLRVHAKLTAPQRTLVLFCVITIPITSFIRSGVISINDFGIHSALFLQFPMLLLVSEILVHWSRKSEDPARPALSTSSALLTPSWLRSIAALAIIFGVWTTLYRFLVIRFTLPLSEINAKQVSNPEIAALSHKAYISYLGYKKLDAAIPLAAVVQYDPNSDWVFWKNVDLISINRQVAISGGQLWCGSELGGDPSGCPDMIAAINPLFRGAPAEQARAICHQYGIQYLVAKVYDPAWNHKGGWVWTLKPVVADPEFRALDCQQ